MDKALEEILVLGVTGLAVGAINASVLMYGVVPFINAVKEYNKVRKNFVSVLKSQYRTDFPYLPKDKCFASSQ